MLTTSNFHIIGTNDITTDIKDTDLRINLSSTTHLYRKLKQPITQFFLHKQYDIIFAQLTLKLKVKN